MFDKVFHTLKLDQVKNGNWRVLKKEDCSSATYIIIVKPEITHICWSSLRYYWVFWNRVGESCDQDMLKAGMTRRQMITMRELCFPQNIILIRLEQWSMEIDNNIKCY